MIGCSRQMQQLASAIGADATAASGRSAPMASLMLIVLISSVGPVVITAQFSTALKLSGVLHAGESVSRVVAGGGVAITRSSGVDLRGVVMPI